ncbi:hypothetical protein tf_34 [Pseudomonas phage tf]|jgi:hypothetical protein|uniref:Uncharacterized protein n=1 Tax=Pseudomonas phage tf TaxID=1114179 RepID=I2FLQ5_9CAUD|nr:hypothetical protein tf_34 [Pseudomonas phage tf]CCE60789.1 hypothetical protein tf_34 [Pseudomonas phage tf]
MSKFTLYGYLSDNGDGSASLHWTSNPDSVDLDDEQYYMCEGDWVEVLTFDSPEAARACGLSWSDEEGC